MVKVLQQIWCSELRLTLGIRKFSRVKTCLTIVLVADLMIVSVLVLTYVLVLNMLMPLVLVLGIVRAS